MEYRTLGRTGLRVSAVALGCEGFMNRPEEEVRADFDFAIENGINFLDLYASNPELRSSIGAALAGRREGFVIQGHLCSVWEEGQYLRTRDPEKAQAAFDDLLARLGTDYVDMGRSCNWHCGSGRRGACAISASAATTPPWRGRRPKPG